MLQLFCSDRLGGATKSDAPTDCGRADRQAAEYNLIFIQRKAPAIVAIAGAFMLSLSLRRGEGA